MLTSTSTPGVACRMVSSRASDRVRVRPFTCGLKVKPCTVLAGMMTRQGVRSSTSSGGLEGGAAGFEKKQLKQVFVQVRLEAPVGEALAGHNELALQVVVRNPGLVVAVDSVVAGNFDGHGRRCERQGQSKPKGSRA